LVLDPHYFYISNPNHTHLPKHQTLIFSFLSVLDMLNVALSMRTWREVRNFAWHRRLY